MKEDSRMNDSRKDEKGKDEKLRITLSERE
jgi:hypothetical protein